MKKLLLIPTLLFPYIIGFCGYFLVSGTFMKELFNDNAYNLLFTLLLFWLLAMGCMVWYTYIVQRKGIDYLKLVKITLWIKLIHIPAYVALFVISIIFLFNIFTIVFTVGAFTFSMLSIMLTGILSCYTFVEITRKGIIPLYTCALVLPMQLFPILDIIGMIIVYKKIK